MAQSFVNNFTTTLNGNITSGATTLNPTTATGSPATGPFTIMVYVLNANGTISNSEIMLVTAGFGTTTWTVSRAQEGTVAVAHTSGEQISQIWSLAGLQSLGAGFWPSLAPSGLTGATAATRWVGATAAGAPTTGGPFNVGDLNVDQLGRLWVCITAGSPGTWLPAGGGAPLVCRIYATSSAGVLPSATNGWGGAAATIDPSAMLTNAGTNSSVTIPVTGYWRVYHQVMQPGQSPTQEFAAGFNNVIGAAHQLTGGNSNQSASVADVTRFTAGTVVQPTVANLSSSTTLSAFLTGNNNTYATFEFVGPG